MTASDTQTWLADTDPLRVVPLDDPIVEALGYDAESDYAEMFWLPVIGPTALWALRRLNRWLQAAPDGYPLAIAPFARELGLGDGVGRSSPAVRSLARLVAFGLADVNGGQLMVRRKVPPLARRHVQRLPGHLAAEHQAAMEANAPQRTTDTNIVALRGTTVAGERTGSVGEAGPSARRAPASQPSSEGEPA
ncbi:MAG: hypothetical protein ACLGHT_09485 [Acidimicrobiia bacterium]